VLTTQTSTSRSFFWGGLDPEKKKVPMAAEKCFGNDPYKLPVGPPVMRNSRHVFVECQLRKMVVDCG
jgi:hypothetical protein